MRSEEAQIGKQETVRADHRSLTLRGPVGTIEKRWGDPTYIALDVLLDDGTQQLFWHCRPYVARGPPREGQDSYLTSFSLVPGIATLLAA